jgi:hypothetical protein
MDTEPNGCRHCGIPEREHVQRWKPAVGWHKWAAPTDSQRLQRMRARGVARTLCGECQQPYQPGPHNTTGFCSWACFDAGERPGAPEALAVFLGPGVVMLQVDGGES